jgi:hypothetical protein
VDLPPSRPVREDVILKASLAFIVIIASAVAIRYLAVAFSIGH